MDRLYPIFLKLTAVPVLVVGGGAVATRKVRRLVESGAKVTVISPESTEELQGLAELGRITFYSRTADKADLAGFSLIYLSTDNPQVNAKLAQAAIANGVWVNVADGPELSTFYLPAVVERERLQIAISTAGSSPALARSIRLELEEQFGSEYDLLLEVEAYLRSLILDEVEPSRRGELFRRLAQKLPTICREAKTPAQLRENVELLLGKEIFSDFLEFEQRIARFFR